MSLHLHTAATALGITLYSWASALGSLEAASDPPSFREDRLLLLPRPHANRQALAKLHANAQAEVLRSFPDLGGLQVVRVPAGAQVEDLVREYSHSESVAAAEPDYWVRLAAMPNDPAFTNGTQWALHNTGQKGALADADIDAPEAWDLQSPASNMVVALIDSGVRLTHQDLYPNLWVNPGEIPDNAVDDDGNGFVDDVHGLNAITGTGAVSDVAGHGTHLAGIIGAVGNNGLGMAGTAWGVQIMICRFIDSTGAGSISDAVTCIEYARTMGADVINASWVTTNASAALELAVSRARDAGIIFVAGAGNDATDNDRIPYYPPNLPLDNVISVAATTSQDRLWDRSNFGADSVDLAAPGVSIHSAFFIADNNYLTMAGSSQAAAFVSGAAALVRAAFPTASHQEVIDRILYGSDPLPTLQGKCLTGGRLNLRGALEPLPPALWPHAPLLSHGNSGYGAAPASQSFVVLNRDSATLDWTASVTEPWLSIDPTSGGLVAGQKTRVTVGLIPQITNFAAGHYTNLVQFHIRTGEEPIGVAWTLHLHQPARLQLVRTGASGEVHLGLKGPAGGSYVTEASTTMIAWRAVTTNTLPPSGDLPALWNDPATNRRSFYRARILDPSTESGP